MKIAVSSRGETLQDELDPSFGRCAGFVVYDSVTLEVSFLDNSGQRNSPQGAGIQTAQMVSGSGIDVLISGQFGPRAMQALSQSAIQLFISFAPTVQEAIEAWKSERVSPVSTASEQSGAKRGMGGVSPGRSPRKGAQGILGGGKGKGLSQGGKGKGGRKLR
ncbi:MAG: NifB/NifX family molybdenum-iron cluster-binding protein [Thermodesulfobacteriota bacterium]